MIRLCICAGFIFLLLAAGCSGQVNHGAGPPAPPSAERAMMQPAKAARRSAPPADPGDAERLRRIARERTRDRPTEAYLIGPGDLLKVNVFDLQEMNRRVRVAQSGYVQLPLIGAVRAAGRTESELAQDVVQRLSRDYLHDPQVDVFVEEYQSQQVAVTGAVAKPGLYPLTRERYTILEMISESGGLTKDAGSVIEFIPVIAGRSSPIFAVASASDHIPPGAESADALAATDAISIDLQQLLRGGAALNVAVAAGDVIFVPEAGTFTIEGWVDKPGTYPLGRHTTVLAAISAGGGPLFPARLGKVQVLRSPVGGAAREGIEVDLNDVREGRDPDMPLRGGDIVRVPAYGALVLPWSVYEFVRNLVSIGASLPII